MTSRPSRRPTRTRSSSLPATTSARSPLISAAFHDEPTIEALNALGLDVSASATTSSTRASTSCCASRTAAATRLDGCQTGDAYAGADFQFLAANVVYKDNGKPIFPAYTVQDVGGVKVGFIGLTLEGTPQHRQRRRHPDRQLPRRGDDDQRGRPRARRPGRQDHRRAAPRGRRPVGADRNRTRSTPAPASPAPSSTSSHNLDAEGRHGHQRPHPPRLQLHAAQRGGTLDPGHQRVVVRPAGDRHRHDDQHEERPADADLASTTRSSSRDVADDRRRRHSSTSTTRPSRRSPTRSSARSPPTSRNTEQRRRRVGAGRRDRRRAAGVHAVGASAQFAFMNPGGIRADPHLRAAQRRRGAGPGHVRRGLHRPAVQQPRRRPRT